MSKISDESSPRGRLEPTTSRLARSERNLRVVDFGFKTLCKKQFLSQRKALPDKKRILSGITAIIALIVTFSKETHIFVMWRNIN